MATLLRNNLNPRVLAAEYAVRGELVLRAMQYREKLKQGFKLPFTEIVACNIGNPHSLNQMPITYIRQVLSCVVNPSLIGHPESKKLFPQDALNRAQKYLCSIPGGLGAYSESQGLDVVRDEVAAFIQNRDGYPSSRDSIFISDGASPAVQRAIKLLIRDSSDGILIPLPQYPLYSATLSVQGGSPIGYYLDEENDWSLSIAELTRSITEARKRGVHPRALVVINPGNPTGQCLSESAMRDIIDFCHRQKVVLLADEVYQENVYIPDRPFVSFKKVLRSMGAEYNDVELMSFHSISKGFLGECGLRGGYVELTNVKSEVVEQYYKICSINLCSNTVGQVTVGLMVNPPKPEEESYPLYNTEKSAILASLKRRAVKLVAALNKLEGVTCNPAQGAMYVFPKVTLPRKAVEAAAHAGKAPDTFYALSLLDETGIVVVPGSGFGQMDGTWHFRSTFLPSEEKIDAVITLLSDFHGKFMDKYRD
eukprot:TRINITY_DN2064_c0_g1::TRINITY_DN2064_c0_g1_i1::g.21748::m.21748 TRINITY_DN2064_c0_g1::TRINITY_DN2064_c0_g1_i1::g.21748  ORF type:complete len:493 (-),score=128.30,sp/P52894/ALA2_HORVU/55.62/0.0,Aminotran_1_2/PF00155.16/2.2e-39,Beta_elim_lyase/PF01212.16/0.0068 TRINITY_DN2064_c0_g1_i1:212-1651(-)